MGLGKVANIVQNNLGNLTGGGLVGIAGGVVGAILDKGKNSVQTNAAAAKILNKSPLELNDTSPTAHMKQNPYEYGTVWYPENVQNLGTGHYMLFDIIVNDKTTFQNTKFNNTKINPNKDGYINQFGYDTSSQAGQQKGFTSRVAQLKTGESRITQISSGINKFGKHTHNFVTDTVVLYTPPGLKTSYKVDHEGAETGMLGNLAGFMGAGFSLTSLGELVGRLKESGAQFLTEIAAAGLAIIPGGGDLKAVLQKNTGRAFNNNLEMTFRGVPMREFTFTFEFAPKNKRELKSAQQIINLFKFHMHPEIGWGNDFIVPSEFQMTYMYMENQNSYIPKISRCVLKTLDLQHGDEGVFSTFVSDEFGAAPIYTKMTLTFAETEIMTKKTIADGM